ncbi:Bll3046 protein [hydrothermal vent metagenome]|uniref:Bll3046 protein n=1 Tax=hydrothermal vent metagenome TaxID=652676 RepID=A0A3B0TUD2_9ZZZZ
MPVDRRTLLTMPFAGAIGAGAAMVGQSASARTGTPAAYADASALGVAPDNGDVTTALQGAIDHLSGTGGTLLLPPGRYRISGLHLRTGVTLRGAGPASRLVSEGSAPAIAAEAQANTGLADLTLTAPIPGGGRGPVIACTDVEGITFAQLNISGGKRGIELARSSGSIRGCMFSDHADVAIFSMDASGLEITHNTIGNCGNNGIQIWRGAPGNDSTLVSANRITDIRADAGGSGQYGNGINVFRAGGVLASGNRIENCAYSAFRSNAGSDCQFVGNSCFGLGEVAIYAEFGFEGALIANNLIDDAATGISITNFNEGGRLAVVSGNLIRNLRTRDHFDARGNGIGVEADTLVSGNVIENAPFAGITLGWGEYLRDVAVTNNLIRDCRWGITASVAAGAGATMISANMISGARETAIQGMEYERASGGELIGGAPAKWPHLTIAGNVGV